MGAERSQNHFFHRWKVWGVPGQLAGNALDSVLPLAEDAAEAIRRRFSTTTESIGGEALRGAQMSNIPDAMPRFAGQTIVHAVVKSDR